MKFSIPYHHLVPCLCPSYLKISAPAKNDRTLSCLKREYHHPLALGRRSPAGVECTYPKKHICGQINSPTHPLRVFWHLPLTDNWNPFTVTFQQITDISLYKNLNSLFFQQLLSAVSLWCWWLISHGQFRLLKSNIKLSFILPILQFFDDRCLKYRKTLNSINKLKLQQLIYPAT